MRRNRGRRVWARALPERRVPKASSRCRCHARQPARRMVARRLPRWRQDEDRTPRATLVDSRRLAWWRMRESALHYPPVERTASAPPPSRHTEHRTAPGLLLSAPLHFPGLHARSVVERRPSRIAIGQRESPRSGDDLGAMRGELRAKQQSVGERSIGVIRMHVGRSDHPAIGV